MVVPQKRNVVIGILGPTLDNGRGAARWERWRPSVAICQHEDFLVDRFELIVDRKFAALARVVEADIKAVSPETAIALHTIELQDPWDFQEVFGILHDLARTLAYDIENEDYLVHITTGTHVAQICLFLLTEARYFPGKLLQTAPPGKWGTGPGSFSIIDLDLSRYDKLATRFSIERQESASILKSGIETRNARFNQLIERIERVASASKAPILLIGPTGAGKSHLARRIFQLKKSRRQVDGALVEINCATLRGDGAMSSLFGHRRGAFTGAVADRQGLLRAADGGVLFLDEIGELALDEQAMLLRSLEEKRFLPVGSDKESQSDFQLIAGTNRDLAAAVRQGRFREDLLARINLWTFELPALRDRQEDVEPNLRYELEQYAQKRGVKVTFNREAEKRFMDYATSAEALWPANFRDLNAAVTRMATLADAGRINVEIVDEEVQRLRSATAPAGADEEDEQSDLLARYLNPSQLQGMDLFDAVQLAEVIRVCSGSKSMSDAGRRLFAASRLRNGSSNDADRIRKYLARFGLTWKQLGNEADKPE